MGKSGWSQTLANTAGFALQLNLSSAALVGGSRLKLQRKYKSPDGYVDLIRLGQ